MTDYTSKSYGRNEELGLVLKMFKTGRDIAMPGPRRLGKTFLLDRLVEHLPRHGWSAVKVEISGLNDQKSVFRELCSKIGSQRSRGQQTVAWLAQRMGQALAPRIDANGPWHQPFLSLDHETYFERLIAAMNEDTTQRWALLIDELPIFLKALHDKGPDGISTARNFMNLVSRLRASYPRVRWLITGSIGLEPLAQVGQYMGVLAKFDAFALEPLTVAQAKDFVCDQALSGALMHRNRISDAEADALVSAAGWRSAYYLDALAQKLSGAPTDDVATAQANVDAAVNRLLQPSEARTFGVWDEHLQKHYAASDQTTAIGILSLMAKETKGLTLNALMAGVNQPNLSRDGLKRILQGLHVEGFVTCEDWQDESVSIFIRNPLLRMWWERFPPSI